MFVAHANKRDSTREPMHILAVVIEEEYNERVAFWSNREGYDSWFSPNEFQYNKGYHEIIRERYKHIKENEGGS